MPRSTQIQANPSDSEAVRSVQGLFLSHIDVIRYFIRALVRDQSLAEDVLQETFLTVVRKAEEFQVGTNFPKWACAVARLKVLEARRRGAGRMTFLSSEAIEALAQSELSLAEDGRQEMLQKCIEDLPANMKRMIEMRYVVDRKPAEIAKLLGWSSGAVYVGLSRARSALKDCLKHKLNASGEWS